MNIEKRDIPVVMMWEPYAKPLLVDHCSLSGEPIEPYTLVGMIKIVSATGQVMLNIPCQSLPTPEELASCQQLCDRINGVY